MKRVFALALGLIIILAFCGCAQRATAIPEVSPTIMPVSILNAAIADIDGDTLLLAGMDGEAQATDLFTVSQVPEITAADGSEAAMQDLKPGMSVVVEYEGNISGNTLGRKITARRISIISEGSDLISFYRDVVKELMATDAALNSDIDTVAFDLSQLHNLREPEKSALMYLAAGDAGLEFVSGTYEELCEKGLIDKKQLYFPAGVLITHKSSDESADAFTFSMSKWRGGLAAVGTDDCKAELKGGVWSYTTGVGWIS